MAFGSLDRLAPLELMAMLLALVIPPGATIGGLVLGRRTPPRTLFRAAFERAISPPGGLAVEGPGRTVARSVGIAVALAAGMLPLVAGGLAFAQAVMGHPRDQLTDHLAEASALVAGEWVLVCAAVCFTVRRWIEQWEADRGRAVLCPPLHSGLLAPVYYVSADAAVAGDVAARAARPPSTAPPSPGEGSGSARRAR